MIKRNKTKTNMFMYLKDRSITMFFLFVMSHTRSYKNLMVTVFF